jgi:DNA polymerase III subunit delta'
VSAITRGGLWGAVPGQAAATAVLRAAVDRDEVAHAWLLVGPHGVGQDAAVRALAADLNCARTDETGAACGSCDVCRRVAADSHPAARTFEPEGVEHVVGAVRERWLPAATRTLVEGRTRVLRIAQADRMNEGAQNAFLKVLEEPPAGTVWVLEAEDPESLLDTVVSRCRRLDFAPWTPETLAMHAERLGAPSDERDGLVRAAMGSPERLADLIEDELTPPDERYGEVPARERHLGLVGRLATDGPGLALPLAKEIDEWAKHRVKLRKAQLEAELSELEVAYGGEWPPGVRQRETKRMERRAREERRRSLGLALDDLASYLRDLVFVGSGGDVAQAVNADHADALRRDAGGIPPAAALAGLRAVADCAAALDRQGQPELHLERLLLRLGAEIYRVS